MCARNKKREKEREEIIMRIKRGLEGKGEVVEEEEMLLREVTWKGEK